MIEFLTVEHSFAAGLLLSAFFATYYFVYILIESGWAMIDDVDTIESFKITQGIQKVLLNRIPNPSPRSEMKKGETYYKYINPKDSEDVSDGSSAFWFPVFILFLIPPVLFLIYNIFPYLIAGLAVYGMLYLARFARRLSKRFEVHVKDKDIHKDVDDES